MQNHNEKPKTELKYRAYVFALSIIRFIDSLDKKDYTIRIISDQILRSATSIGANIIEARGSSSKKDFTNFFTYSLKSANETKFWLGLLRDSGKAPRDFSNQLLTEVAEVASILGSSILTLKGKK